MLFPISKLWSAPIGEDTVGKMDRYIADRSHRLNAGICLSNDFRRIDGCLVVTSGRGKYLRLRESYYQHHFVPENISKSLKEVCESEGSITQLNPILFDLAEVQASLVGKLKAQASKAVDRILTVSVSDPGFWTKDFDHQSVYQGLCDANRLAELTGITVVDNFPGRELTVGGNGNRLECLPYWIAFADRSPKVSTQTRLIIEFSDDTLVYKLPPSDGLDAEVPEIQFSCGVGLDLTRRLFVKFVPNEPLDDSTVWTEVAKLYVGGRSINGLIDVWNTSSNLNLDTRKQNWLEEARRIVGANENEIASAIHTSLEIIGAELRQSVNLPSEIQGLMAAMPIELHGCLVNLLDELFPGVKVDSHQSGIGGDGLGCLTAALLGLMHIDQLPANIPWITGADCQRILGRLTPGRPANWRQLVLDMADYCPPAMKLRDAV